MEINGHQISFKVWEGKRVYVRVPSKSQGHQQVGFYNIRSGEFVEDQGKGMLQWLQYQAGISRSELIEMCKVEANPQSSKQNYVPFVNGSGIPQ